MAGTHGQDCEMLVYEGLALQYYYLGEQGKSKYYNDRVMRGKLEAKFSVVRKMTLNHFTRTQNYYGSDSHISSGKYDIGKGLASLLTMDHLGKGFATHNQVPLITEKFEKAIEQAKIGADRNQRLLEKKPMSEALVIRLDTETAKYGDEETEKIQLRLGTPISESSGRGLPSPNNVKGESNILVLPFY